MSLIFGVWSHYLIKLGNGRIVVNEFKSELLCYWPACQLLSQTDVFKFKTDKPKNKPKNKH